MSRDQLTIGTDTRPPVLFRGDYEQWKARFFDFLERQNDGEVMIEVIKNGQEKIYEVITDEDGNTSLTGKEKTWTQMTESEKSYVKAAKLAKSHIINAIPNDIFMNIDSQKTAKSMFDEITNQLQGSKVGKSIKMINAMNKFESFKAKDDEMLEQTYNRYCGVLNELRKNGFLKSNLETNVKFMKTLKPVWKRFTSNIMQNMNIQNSSVHDIFECLMQNEEDVLEIESQSKAKATSDDPLALMMKKIDDLATKTSLQENNSKAFLHQIHQSLSTDDLDSDDSEEEMSQVIALLSNMMNKRRFGKSNGQRFQSTQKNFTNNPQQSTINNSNAKFNRNRSSFNNNQSSKTATFSQDHDTTNQETSQKEAPKTLNTVVCYKCLGNGHFARDCKVKVVKNSEYYRKKMLIERQKEAGGEKGQAFLSEDAHWMSDSDCEEQASAHFAHMALMADVDLDMLDEDEVGNYITDPVRLQTCISQMRFLEKKT
jgi:hypothetical protein